MSDYINGTLIGDAGNSRSDADVISGSGTVNITGRVGGSDSDDYYKFTAASSGSAAFNLTGLSADLDLRLLSSSGASLGSSDAGGSSSESIAFSVVAGQTYYLHVDPYNSAVSNYALSASLPVLLAAPPPVITPPPVQTLDDFSNSTNTQGVHSINGISRGVINTSGDHDWFKVYLSQGEVYQFMAVGGVVDTQMTLRSSSGVEVWSTAREQSPPVNTTTSTMDYKVSAAGNYYLDVSSTNSSTGNYVLSSISSGNDRIGATLIQDAPETFSLLSLSSNLYEKASTISAAGANKVAKVVNINGIFGTVDNDVDYFIFKSPAEGKLDIKLYGFSDSHVSLDFYSSMTAPYPIANDYGSFLNTFGVFDVDRTLRVDIHADTTYYIGAHGTTSPLYGGYSNDSYLMDMVFIAGVPSDDDFLLFNGGTGVRN